MSLPCITLDNFQKHYTTAPEIVLSMIKKYIPVDRTLRVLDFGCNVGIKTLGISKLFPVESVLGCDINDNFKQLPDIIKNCCSNISIPSTLQFKKIKCAEKISNSYAADIIISWSVFEHVNMQSIKSILEDLRETLTANGVFFLQVNPFYCSPQGSHLGRYLADPWIHLLTSGQELKKLLLEKTDACTVERLWSMYQSLNRITAQELEDLCLAAGFKVLEKKIGRTKLKPPTQLCNMYELNSLTIEGFQLVLAK